jgi:AcrR family transcriptional regulator
MAAQPGLRAAQPGLRDRKKQRTRQALIDAAFALISQRGYEQTTVADIAAAADVSTRTFFLHFPAKEDVLLADGDLRIELAQAVIGAAQPGDPPGDVLARAFTEMVAHNWEHDLASGLGALRVKLLASVPALRAAMLLRLFTVQQKLTAALAAAYPDQLDPVEAACAVGAITGAVIAAALASLDQGEAPRKTRDAMLRAIQLTGRHVLQADAGQG